jgi:hypothetical protein
LEPWHSIEKSGEPSDAAWRSGGSDGTSRQGQGKTLDFPAVWRLPPQKRTLFYFAFKMRLDVVKSGHGKTTPD